MIWRRVGGTLAGVAVAGLCISAVEFAGHRLAPSGEGVTPTNAPVGALLAVVLAWLVGAVAGGWVAARISRWHAAPWIIAAVVILGVVMNAAMLPHPWWMVGAGILLPIVAAWLTSRRLNADL